MSFKLTYSTMFDPPAELHQRFDAALTEVRATLGGSHPMWIDGRAAHADAEIEVRSPIDRDWLLARLPRGGAADADRAVAAARRAARAWAATAWRERVAILRRAARLIEERVYALSAAMSLEVGKNRMESLGEVQETADLIDWYCDQFEANDGFDKRLPDDPLKGFASHNRTRLRPYGVWAVIAPFNFPFALAGGPIGAALVCGNTVVFKVASDTAWSGWQLMKIFIDAGVPDGVLNLVSGPGDSVGGELTRHQLVDGVTFTGSHEVGMGIVRTFAGGHAVRPCIAELGGKNATIVTRGADLERAATGIVRSAFGLQGQKCSACSRVYVERAVAGALRARIAEKTRAIAIGDPTDARNWMGPVINPAAQARYQRAVAHLREVGTIDEGGQALDSGALARGWFVAPTLAQAPLSDRLWRDELFVPLVLVGEVDSLEQALTLANDSDDGLTAGFYGASDEIPAFLDQIEAGVTYVNRPQGATTGAWPGYQPFGGWKGSGSTGKAIGSYWYLPLYMREQSQTVVD